MADATQGRDRSPQAMAEVTQLEEGFEDKLDAMTYDEPLSPEDAKKIVRRIDKFLLPVMTVSYLFQFLDKQSLNYSAILGIMPDLKLKGSDYSWASSIYFFGYLAASYPAGMLMVRLPVGRLIAVSIIVWGAILMLTALCQNTAGLLAVRFFLGVAESTVAPGLSIVVGMWYTRREQPLRMGIWFAGTGFAGMIGGAVAYGIGNITTIAAWKALFLVFGALTVTWGSVVYFLLPDEPMKARFLPKVERAKAVQRVAENMTGIKNNTIKWGQCLEAFLDIKVWLLVVIQLAGSIGNGGVTNFNSIVIKGFGFSTLNTMLLQILGAFIQLIFVLLSSFGSNYLRNTRTLWMAWNLVVTVIGAILIMQLPTSNPWGRFAGIALASSFSGNLPLILSLSSGNVGGFTKKTTVNAIIFIAYCGGNIIGPQLFFAREAPSYRSGWISIIVAFAVGTVCCFILRFYLISVNKQRDRENGPGIASNDDEALAITMSDKTDKEIPQFRYVY